MDVTQNKDLAVVKKAGFIEQISKEEFEQRIRCIARSKKDIVWWAENFFRIVSLNTGLGLIKLYDKQKQMLKHLVDNDRCIVLASRQTGKCVFKDTKIKIRNKKTGEIEEITIEEFYNRFNHDKPGQGSRRMPGIHKERVMAEPCDIVERKFIGSVDVSDYEILTDSGWRDCMAVHKTVEYKVWRV